MPGEFRKMVSHLQKAQGLTVTEAIIEAVDHYLSLYCHDRDRATSRIGRIEKRLSGTEPE